MSGPHQSLPRISIRLTEERLAPKPLFFPATNPMDGTTTIGSIIEFYGTVRGREDDFPIEGLHYSAYVSMAEHQFLCLITEIQKEHPVSEVIIHHRLGFVPAGEPSIHLRILSSHRMEGFAFAQAFLTRMKQDVPIWKKP